MSTSSGSRYVCVLVDGRIGWDNECVGDTVWRHVFSIPKECGSLFSFTAEPYIILVFPIYYGGGLRKFCLCVRDGFVESYSHPRLAKLHRKKVKILLHEEEQP